MSQSVSAVEARQKSAKGAAKGYLENFPDETILALRKTLPIKSSDDARRFEEGLRKAGLPE